MDLEVLRDFLVESKELLQKAQEDTPRLETEPGVFLNARGVY